MERLKAEVEESKVQHQEAVMSLIDVLYRFGIQGQCWVLGYCVVVVVQGRFGSVGMP